MSQVCIRGLGDRAGMPRSKFQKNVPEPLTQMIQIRKAAERGFGDHGWLKSYHTFSFAGYRDPAHMGFRALRVMNEDRVAPGQGFGTHAHDNMEIISYVLQGALSHRDSMGNGEVLRPGEFQCISAGSGITHSEFNPSATESVHFYQIWLMPIVRNTEPSYQQKSYSIADKRDRLCLVASPDGRDGTLVIKQDANVYLSLLGQGQRLDYRVPVQRHVWMQLLSGRIELDGQILESGDGLCASDENELAVAAMDDSEFMLFDLA